MSVPAAYDAMNGPWDQNSTTTAIDTQRKTNIIQLNDYAFVC